MRVKTKNILWLDFGDHNYTITEEQHVSMLTYIILKCIDETDIFKIVMISNHIRSKLALTLLVHFSSFSLYDSRVPFIP